jgi:CubicO group peptidase (beta-lactamase class C family)
MKNKFALLLLFSLFCSLSAKSLIAQEKDNSQALDLFLQKVHLTMQGLPAFSVCVVKNGELDYSKAFGYANVSAKEKNTTNTAFYIASLTKSYTSLLALILEDEGKIKLDDAITKYKPFKTLKNKELYEKISIRELLNHTHGLQNDYITWREAYSGDKSLETSILLLEEKTSKRKEGKVFKYDNLGYNLFAILLKAEFDSDWQVLLQQKVFDKLCTTATSAYMSDVSKKKISLAIPYKFVIDSPIVFQHEIMKTDNMMQAAGGMISSIEDAAKFIAMYQNDGKIKNKKVFDAKLLRRGLESSAEISKKSGNLTIEGYCNGWYAAKYKNQEIRFHAGGFSGAYVKILFLPNKNIGYAFYGNESILAEKVCNLVEEFILDFYLNDGSFDATMYYDKLAELNSELPSVQLAYKKQLDKINSRPWQLSLLKREYTGEFYNKYLGTIIVKTEGSSIIVSMGDLKANATAFTEENSIRVQFANSGEIIKFNIVDNKVVSLDFQDERFERRVD